MVGQPTRRRAVIFGLLMAFLYSGVMSGTFALIANGAGWATLALWGRNWAVAFAVAVPAGLLLRPLAERLADRLA